MGGQQGVERPGYLTDTKGGRRQAEVELVSSHRWCPNDTPGYGIDDDDDDTW